MFKESVLIRLKMPLEEVVKYIFKYTLLASFLIIFIPGVTYGYNNPHGSYNATTQMCKDCHTPHGSTEDSLILNSGNRKELCYACHGTAGGSDTDVQTGTGNATSDFGESTIGSPSKTSYHPVSPLSSWTAKGSGDQALSCNDCHTSCIDSTNKKKLLLAGPNGVSSGNDFCLVCHGNSSNPNSNSTKAGYNMGGDHETNYDLGAHSIFVSWTPDSETNIQCENCHSSHGSDVKFLIDYRLSKLYPDEQEFCYKCHTSSVANSWNGRYIKTEFDKPSKHDLNSANGAKVECESCHNSHFVKKGSDTGYWEADRASDPSNTTKLMSQTDSDTETWASTFCLTCHTSTPPNEGFSSTSVVPYSVTFPSMSGYSFFPGWNKSDNDIAAGYGFTDSGHYTLDSNTGKRVGCDNCHDPHASQNPRLTAFTGATTETALPSNHTQVFNKFRDNTDSYLEEKLCFACHSFPSGTDCVQSGCHTANMKNIAPDGGDEAGGLFVAIGGSTSLYKWSPSNPGTWTPAASAPDTLEAGSSLVWNNSNLIYAQVGGGTEKKYDVYKINENNWATEPGIIVSPGLDDIGTGGSIIFDENSQLFSLPGNDNANLHRYSLGGDKWDTAWAGNNGAATPAAAPDVITTGGATVYARDPIYADDTSDPSNASEFIYAFKGGSNTFWKYQIKTNAWNPIGAGDDPADLPAGDNTGDGASLVWTRNDFIYALRGADTTGFWRYSISANTWTQMPAVTIDTTDYPIGAGASLTFDGDKYLYAVEGGSTKAFLRFNILTEEWEALTDLPINITSGSSAVFLSKTIHPYKNYTGRHTDTEEGGQTSFGLTNRHAECNDCHDSHAAKAGTNATKPSGGYGSALGNTISDVLLGTFGVMPIYNGVGIPLSYESARLKSTSTDFQYELCFKCHSDYSGYQGSQTNTAVEFNPANKSQHGVIQAGTNTFINENTTEEPFASTYAASEKATLACDDCHQNSDPNSPRGSHGSDKPNMLKANPDLDLCLICHKASVYNIDTPLASNPSNFDHSIKAWASGSSQTDPDVHMRGKYCRNCHTGRIGDIHGTNSSKIFMTGTHITSWDESARSCTTDSNCHLITDPTKTY